MKNTQLYKSPTDFRGISAQANQRNVITQQTNVSRQPIMTQEQRNQLYKKYDTIERDLKSGTYSYGTNSYSQNQDQSRFVDGKLAGHVGIRGGPIDKKWVDNFVNDLGKPKPVIRQQRSYADGERFNSQGQLNVPHVGIRGGVDLKKYMYPISQQKDALQRPPVIKYEYKGNGERFTQDGRLNISNIVSIRGGSKPKNNVFTLDNYRKGIADNNGKFLLI